MDSASLSFRALCYIIPEVELDRDGVPSPALCLSFLICKQRLDQTSWGCWEIPEKTSANTLQFSAPSLCALSPRMTFLSPGNKVSVLAAAWRPGWLFTSATAHTPHWARTLLQAPVCSYLRAFALAVPSARDILPSALP